MNCASQKLKPSENFTSFDSYHPGVSINIKISVKFYHEVILYGVYVHLEQIPHCIDLKVGKKATDAVPISD